MYKYNTHFGICTSRERINRIISESFLIPNEQFGYPDRKSSSDHFPLATQALVRRVN